MVPVPDNTSPLDSRDVPEPLMVPTLRRAIRSTRPASRHDRVHQASFREGVGSVWNPLVESEPEGMIRPLDQVRHDAFLGGVPWRNRPAPAYAGVASGSRCAVLPGISVRQWTATRADCG